MEDSVSASMTTACRAFGCNQTGIEKGKACPKCGWIRPDNNALESSQMSDIDNGFDISTTALSALDWPWTLEL